MKKYLIIVFTWILFFAGCATKRPSLRGQKIKIGSSVENVLLLLGNPKTREYNTDYIKFSFIDVQCISTYIFQNNKLIVIYNRER